VYDKAFRIFLKGNEQPFYLVKLTNKILSILNIYLTYARHIVQKKRMYYYQANVCYTDLIAATSFPVLSVSFFCLLSWQNGKM